jgi:hypothetical protein
MGFLQFQLGICHFYSLLSNGVSLFSNVTVMYVWILFWGKINGLFEDL